MCCGGGGPSLEGVIPMLADHPEIVSQGFSGSTFMALLLQNSGNGWFDRKRQREWEL
jgi:hypothetical protein